MTYFYIFRDKDSNIGFYYAFNFDEKKAVEKFIKKNNLQTYCFSVESFEDLNFFSNIVCKHFGFNSNKLDDFLEEV